MNNQVKPVRETTGVEREVGRQVQELWKILEDDELCPLWLLFASVEAYWGTEVSGLPPHRIDIVRRGFIAALEREGKRCTIPEWEERATLERHVIERIKVRLPELERIFDEHLPAWLRSFTLALLEESAEDEETKQVFREAKVAAMPTASFERLVENPIRLSDIDGATVKHLLQAHSLLKSLKPARPRGRPKRPAGERATKQQKTTTRVDPELVLRVHRCKLDGMTRQQIAQIVRKALRIPIPSDAKARERLRGRVRTLEVAAARLDRKKSG